MKKKPAVENEQINQMDKQCGGSDCVSSFKGVGLTVL